MARKQSTAAEAYIAFAQGEESDAAIAARLGVTRQRIQTLHAQYRERTKQQNLNSTNRGGNGPADTSLQEKQFAAGHVSAPQPAAPVNATTIERQRLMELAGEDQLLEVLVDKVLRGSAPRAAAIAVGMSGKVFSKRMESDEKFRDLVLRAAHEAESSVAQNLYRMATGNSPQAAQSAIAWLNARVPDDWSPTRQKIEVEVSGQVDVMHILSSPRLIELENQLEAERQQLEDRLSLPAPVGEIIEGEILVEPEQRPQLP